MILYTKFYRILAAFFACALAYTHFTWHENKNKRILSISNCSIPLKECSKSEEAYFRTYPDVAMKGSAYHHWNSHGKFEGKHYVCLCHESKDNVNLKTKWKKDGGFVIITIFKNEAMVFAEWISHYLWQGASHFYLIDNGSTDDWMSKISRGVHARVTVIRDERIQRESYNSLLPMLREKHSQDWALVVDFDEFLYAKPPHMIASYLSNSFG